MNLFLVTSIIISIVTLIIGFWVFFQNRRRDINQCFLLLSFSGVLWMIGVISLFFIHEMSKREALIIGRIPFFGVTLLSGALFYFSQIFPQKNILIPKTFNYLALFIGGIIAILSLITGAVLKDISFEDTTPQAEFGSLFFLFGLFFLILSITSIRIFVLKYRKSKEKTERVQILYLFIGLALSLFIGTLTNLILPQIYPTLSSYKYGPLGVIFFVIFTAYAIIKHHLFEIRVILTELLVGVMGLIWLIFLFLMPTLQLKKLAFLAFLLFCLFAYYLIKATHEEAKRREEAEKIAIQEKALRLQAEKLTAARNQFLLSAQHYFRTPLTSIIGYLEMISRGEYGKEKIAQVLKSALELRKRIEEGLNISQFQAGKDILEKEETQIEDLLKETLAELKLQIEEKGLELQISFPQEKLPKIKIDKKRMREVFSNLIDNAIKHTPKGGISLSLQLLQEGRKLPKEKPSLLFFVRDTGIGIPPEEIKFIGQSPFERGKEARKLSPLGKGIGLYLSNLIVKAHGGRLWAESPGLGKGSTFFVELPIK